MTMLAFDLIGYDTTPYPQTERHRRRFEVSEDGDVIDLTDRNTVTAKEPPLTRDTPKRQKRVKFSRPINGHSL